MGAAGEGKNIAHNVKKMDIDSVKHYRDRFNIPVSDEEISVIYRITNSMKIALK